MKIILSELWLKSAVPQIAGNKSHQIRVCVYHVSEEDHDKVCVDVTFMNLIDDDVRNTSKAGLKFTKKNSHGAEHD